MTTGITVELRDHFGSDLEVVNDARVSFGKESEWEYCRGQYCDDTCEQILTQCPKLNAADENLIQYLARGCSRGEWDKLITEAQSANEGHLRDILRHIRHMPTHWSPFAHCKLKFRITAPIFVARQYVKHQVGFDWNEISRRYVDSDIEFFWPEDWRAKADNVKQGSGGALDIVTQEFADEAYAAGLDACETAYQRLLELGVCTEQARMILPLSLQTTWIMTGSLYGWSRVCHSRLDNHAQEEASDLAEQIAIHCREHFPISWQALMDS